MDLLGLSGEALRQILLDLVPLGVEVRHSLHKGADAARKRLVIRGGSLVAL